MLFAENELETINPPGEAKVNPAQHRIILSEAGEWSLDSGVKGREDTRQAIIEALWGKMAEAGTNTKATEEAKKAVEDGKKAIEDAQKAAKDSKAAEDKAKKVVEEAKADAKKAEKEAEKKEAEKEAEIE